MTDRRTADRFRRRVPVHFWRPGESYRHSGFTSDVSTTGMFLATEEPLARGSRIRVAVGASDLGFFVEGEVTHSNKRESHLSSARRVGMGVRFLPMEKILAKLVPELEASLTQNATPSDDGLYRVCYAGAEQFLEVYERDVQTGGLFVATQRPAAARERVEIKVVVEHSGIRPLRLAGTVVYRAEPTPPGEDSHANLMAGMGVELDAVSLRKVESFVTRLRRQGGTEPFGDSD